MAHNSSDSNNGDNASIDLPESADTEFDSFLRKAARVSDDLLPLPRPGQLIGEKYRIEASLGSGAMGAVFRATHTLSQKPVALKWMLGSSGDARAQQRFVREAKVAARVDHPNVVDVYDVGQEGPCWYLVMELLHGESLRFRLRRELLEIGTVVDLLLPAMRGVAAVHRAGIIHRDLKPDNIFLCTGPDDEPREAKVLDFGVSAIAAAPGDPTLTEDGALLGTPAYMSPEQLQNARVIDARSDVYSFGVILYEALTGEVPFSADSYPALVLAVVNSHPRQPSELRSALPSGLADIVMRALSKNPDARQPSIEALMAELAPYSSQPASGAFVVPTVALKSRQPRKTRVRPLLVGAALLALALGAWLTHDRLQRTSSQSSATAAPLDPPPTAAPATEPPPAQAPALPEQTGSAPMQVGAAPNSGAAQSAQGGAAHAPSGATEAVPAQVGAAPTAAPTPDNATALPAANAPVKSPTKPDSAGKRKAAKPKPNCDPPYDVNAAGHWIFRPECRNYTPE
jgi:eukaryotic-like serine/threonine-protein kinase